MVGQARGQYTADCHRATWRTICSAIEAYEKNGRWEIYVQQNEDEPYWIRFINPRHSNENYVYRFCAALCRALK